MRRPIMVSSERGVYTAVKLVGCEVQCSDCGRWVEVIYTAVMACG